MKPKLNSFLRYQFPALLWAALIFILSSLPGSRLPIFAHYINDKVIHVSIFCAFGLLVYRALQSVTSGAAFNVRRAIISVTIVILYGILDEIHQGFVPGRTVDVLDATADAIGGILSMVIVYFDSRRRSKV